MQGIGACNSRSPRNAQSLDRHPECAGACLCPREPRPSCEALRGGRWYPRRNSARRSICAAGGNITCEAGLGCSEWSGKGNRCRRPPSCLGGGWPYNSGSRTRFGRNISQGKCGPSRRDLQERSAVVRVSARPTCCEPPARPAGSYPKRSQPTSRCCRNRC